MNGGILITPVLALPWLRNVSILMNDSTDTEAQIWAGAPPELCAAGLEDNMNLVWVRHESCSSQLSWVRHCRLWGGVSCQLQRWPPEWLSKSSELMQFREHFASFCIWSGGSLCWAAGLDVDIHFTDIGVDSVPDWDTWMRRCYQRCWPTKLPWVHGGVVSSR